MTNLLQMLAEQNAVDRFFLPHTASNLARDVDWAWNFVLGVCTFFFVVVVAVMIFFIIKYRRRTPTDQTPEITHNTPLEIMWTGIPLVLVMVIFYVGFRGFINYDTPASDSTVIEVQAKQWSFQFTYPNGAVDENLYLQKGVPAVMKLQSVDVLHALYIPAFRIQRNAVPGRVTEIWCIPEEVSPKEGFDAFCTQYCGQGHSQMGARVYVLANKEEYDKKMAELANPFKEKDAAGVYRWVPYYQVGEKFYHTYGCIQCHNVDGAAGGTGPTWKGLWKSDVAFSASDVPGYTLTAGDSDAKWQAYIEESILQPEVKIVSGYQNVMPTTFGAQFSGSPAKTEKLRALLQYIKFVGAGYDPKTNTNPTYMKEHHPNPTANPDLFNVDASHPVPPESLAAEHPTASAPAP